MPIPDPTRNDDGARASCCQASTAGQQELLYLQLNCYIPAASICVTALQVLSKLS